MRLTLFLGVLAAGCSGGGGGGNPTPTPCVESWVCTPWMTGGAGDAGTRTCTDANACGTTANKPPEAATLPALNENYYRCNVEPIFDRLCAQQACHGSETRPLRTYARGRLRITGETWIEPGCLQAGTPHPSEECIGSVECRCWTLPHSAAEWRRNYDSARGFGLDQATALPIPAGSEDTSELISQAIVGGRPHAGYKLFAAASPEHVTLNAWLSGASLGTCNTQN